MNYNTNCGIYKITNIVNGKFYIGSSKDLNLREKKHFYELKRNKHHSQHLQNAFNKYGEQNFFFEVIELVQEEILLEVEQKYLDEFKPFKYNIGYNVSTKATNCVLTGEKHWTYGLPAEEHHWYGKTHKEETKRKIGEAQKGELNHAYGKQSPFKGRKHTEKAIEKMRVSQLGKQSPFKGRKHTEKAIEKMRMAAIGRPVSDKVINKNPKWIENMSKAQKGKRMGKENPNAKGVTQFNLLGEYLKDFGSLREASDETGANINLIIRCCKGKGKTAGGYKWMYKEEYEKTKSAN